MLQTRLIDENRAALLRLVAFLVRSMGLAAVEGGALPRYVRCNVLRVLRPAESAVRRLIVVVAQAMGAAPERRRAAPAGLLAIASGDGERALPFPLFDRRKRFGEVSRPPAGTGPRLFFFTDDEVFVPADRRTPLSDDAVGTEQIHRRIESLKTALADLPKQARRLLRAQARRALAPPGPGRYGPLRPGLPPGMKARAQRRVDEILEACHYLALNAQRKPPDTS